MARAARGALAGRLRIGVIPTVAPYLLPDLIGRLTAANADLDIHIRETVTPRLLVELQAGRLDTAIVALPVSEPWLTEVALFAEDFVLVRPAADAAVLPVEAHMTALDPSSTAFEIAIVIPRSLNEPVGFMPSYFT